jgi:hypothetical protein
MKILLWGLWIGYHCLFFKLWKEMKVSTFLPNNYIDIAFWFGGWSSHPPPPLSRLLPLILTTSVSTFLIPPH